MKISEFEAKLGTVTEDRLRQMLAFSRAQGPEIAVELILAEGRKRGLENLEGGPGSAREPSPFSATSAYAKEGAGAFGADAPAPIESAPAPADPDSPAPALAPEWLSEETKTGLPVAVKALLAVLVLGGVLALAWKFSH